MVSVGVVFELCYYEVDIKEFSGDRELENLGIGIVCGCWLFSGS